MEKDQLSTLGGRLRAARKSKGLSQKELAEMVGLEQPSISDIELGKTRETAKLTAIAEALEVRSLWLLKRQGPRMATEPEEPSIASNATIVGNLQSGSRIPVIGTAQLTDNEHFVEMDYPSGEIGGYIDLPSRDPDAYAVRCRGDSMAPRIKHGEFVIVEPSVEVRPGDDVLVQHTDGRVMVKQLLYWRDGRVTLVSVNATHPPVSIDEGDVKSVHRISGRVDGARFVTD